MPVLQQRIHFYLVARLGCGVLQAMHRTWRVDVIDPQRALPGIIDGSRPAIVAFWHRHILSMLAHFRNSHVTVPVSEHRDGEYVAQAMEQFGLDSVRGSTTRGAARLLRGLMERVRQGWSPVLTPDGPRGPRFSVQPGFTMLARRSGLPVYPIGLAVGKAWVLSSWDAFVVPRPFTRIAIRMGAPLRATDFAEAPAFCEALRAAMFEATDQAQQALATPQ
jgi:lysophospholipid acyltransferase (LPLAT)-like uncharacterized protein